MDGRAHRTLSLDTSGDPLAIAAPQPMLSDRRRSPGAFVLVCLAALVLTRALWILSVYAQGLAAPGGFLESATSTSTRPMLTPAQLAAFLPATRGPFAFPAPYNTTGIRLTTADDCGGSADCVDYVGYAYWRTMNNSAGSNFLYAFVGLDRNRGGAGPSLFRYDKTTGETVNLGPLFDDDTFSWDTGEGWYFSATQPTTLYYSSERQLLRLDILTHASTEVFDITSQFGADKNIWQLHSSNDDRVHSFTLRRNNDDSPLGCAVYREDTHQFSYVPAHGDYDECQIDKSGQWLLIKEDIDGLDENDNRIIDLATGTETILLDPDGAGGHSDNGFGSMVAADNYNDLPNAVRLWTFGPLTPGPVVYHDPDWSPQSVDHISFANARSAPLGQQYACGSAANRINGPRANEIVCFRLDGSLRTLVVAPVMTDLDAPGGGGDDYAKAPKGSLDPTGQYFMWTSNLGGNRLDAFIVRVPSQVLVPADETADTTAPTIALTAPAAGATVGGAVGLTATASDNVGVVGVQFKADGATVGPEATSAPYEATWTTSTVPDGVHEVTAVARDAAGNTTTSAPITVTVLNVPVAPRVSAVEASGVTADSALISWHTDQLADAQVEYGVTATYGQATAIDAALGTSHAQVLTSLTAGTTYHYRVRSTNAQGVAATSDEFTFATRRAPQMTAPPPGSTLRASTVAFQWTGGTQVSEYYLWVGTSPGADDLAVQGQGTSLSGTITGLPVDGRTLCVRLWSLVGPTWQFTDYSYITATSAPARAQMATPAPSSTLTASTVAFEWTGGAGVTQYYLWVGTSPGANDLAVQDRNTSLTGTVLGLPVDGRTIYVRLWSLIGGVWQSYDYAYPTTAVTTPARAQLTSPAPGSTLMASTVAFQWTGGVGVSEYYLWVGTSAGANDLINQDQGTSLGGTVTRLPIDGRTLYVRLWSLVGTWQFCDAVYKTSPTPLAQMATPPPGSTLTASTVRFEWTGGMGVAQYVLWVGTSPGANDLTTQDCGTNLTATVTGLPADGRTLHVRLWSLIGPTWQSNDYAYSSSNNAAAARAQMTTPAPGSTLTASTAAFQWAGGIGVSQYVLWVGTSSGANDLAILDRGTNLGATVTGLQVDGRTLHVRLWSLIGSWQFHDYTYTASSDQTPARAQMSTPAPGLALTASSVAFQWTGGTGASQYVLWVGTAAGASDLANQDRGTNLNATVTGLPVDGRTLYVRLWSLLAGGWRCYDYTYRAPSP
jgi:hypothetical protein